MLSFSKFILISLYFQDGHKKKMGRMKDWKDGRMREPQKEG
jgi:hypothetical protein